MHSKKIHVTAGLALAFAAAIALSGCTSATTAGSMDDTAPSQQQTETPMAEETMMDPAANLVGPACQAYADAVPDGDGSIEGMSQDPVAVAASNNPMLTTLTAAVSGQLNPDVNLVDTLNGSEFTVFAPVDDAFAKIDPATIEKLKTDSDLLSSILTYHVVPGQASPAQVIGMHKTVQGADVTVTGGGNAIKVNDAGVVCGGVRTANATVYLIDTVLMPAAN